MVVVLPAPLAPTQGEYAAFGLLSQMKIKSMVCDGERGTSDRTLQAIFRGCAGRASGEHPRFVSPPPCRSHRTFTETSIARRSLPSDDGLQRGEDDPPCASTVSAATRSVRPS